MKHWQVAGLLGCLLVPFMVQASPLAPSPFDLPHQQAQPAEKGMVAPDGEKDAVITELPTEEHAFVQAIGKLDKAKIVALLGEPAKADDVKLKDSGRVVASIWHYHYINTSPEGTYYETTELDFIDDKVDVVVFLNNDGSETEQGKTFEVPAQIPTM